MQVMREGRETLPPVLARRADLDDPLARHRGRSAQTLLIDAPSFAITSQSKGSHALHRAVDDLDYYRLEVGRRVKRIDL
jgi:hypothetical protein